jgi:hypothetical protein
MQGVVAGVWNVKHPSKGMLREGKMIRVSGQMRRRGM